MPALSQSILRRRAVASRYCEGLAGLALELPSEIPGARHSYHLFVLRSDDRNRLEKHLTNCGIGTGRHYPLPVHKQPGLAAGARIPERLTVTEKFEGEILSLPMFSTITDAQVLRVIEAVRSFFG
jgi:dTDP-4-amino-4,6-dideoxygalactose transaminase